MKNFFKNTLFKITGITNCGTPAIQMNKVVSEEVYKEVMIDIPYLRMISPAYIQRRYKVDYDIAFEVMNLLEDKNMIGPSDGAKPRLFIHSNI